jgi:hypothetical protein
MYSMVHFTGEVAGHALALFEDHPQLWDDID